MTDSHPSRVDRIRRRFLDHPFWAPIIAIFGFVVAFSLGIKTVTGKAPWVLIDEAQIFWSSEQEFDYCIEIAKKNFVEANKYKEKYVDQR